jgi:uncharacterized 2Fe-2S/4Fe-4S cluster protein (DUF4445 family)
MTRIVFTPSSRNTVVAAGTRLLEAARGAGIEIDAPCGGEGACGRCIVRVTAGVTTADSLGILPQQAVDEGYVLACRTTVLDAELTVDVPELAGRTGGKFVEDGDDSWLSDSPPLVEQSKINPLVRTLLLHAQAPQLEDGLSDLERLSRVIRKETGYEELEYPLPVVRTLAEALRKNEGEVRVALMPSRGSCAVIDVRPGNRPPCTYGVAVDVGTTTVAVQLVCLETARAVARRTDYNGQIACGMDVISRIHYARDPVRREELRIRVLGTINNLIRKVARSGDIPPEEITGAVIAGNTTMMHLLLGLDPEHIRLAPYTPTLLEASRYTAGEVGINIHAQSRLFLCPGVGSYVGGDITSGLLCAGLTGDPGSVSLFMDIGTNGELVVGNRDFLLTCACSAGPAFAGGGIGQGMRAAAGAIERVEIDPETGSAKYWTIGDIRPVGICGSGMISLLAGLYRTGWIDQAGKFRRERESPAIVIEGRRGTYRVVPEGESGADAAISVSEADIENIMRAKAAVYAAIGLLLTHAGIGIGEIDRVYIAGGFGRFLNLEDAITIGLIPDLPRSRFSYLGNSSLAGASKALVSGECRERMSKLARSMTYVELNTNPAYMDQYTSALFLPHTDSSLFPSVQTAPAVHRQ